MTDDIEQSKRRRHAILTKLAAELFYQSIDEFHAGREARANAALIRCKGIALETMIETRRESDVMTLIDVIHFREGTNGISTEPSTLKRRPRDSNTAMPLKRTW
jgi:hypothetical protein